MPPVQSEESWCTALPSLHIRERPAITMARTIVSLHDSEGIISGSRFSPKGQSIEETRNCKAAGKECGKCQQYAEPETKFNWWLRCKWHSIQWQYEIPCCSPCPGLPFWLCNA
ncbi:unnamed protein product [Ostreobium quekettii]|uniref:Uncharacterized protein n=1 Tax=Ostreobium quekettii TaxID=121088 RepID=A0A8S1J892_9CHLO|nr:unnamed protein product [Ostreobium quekettii]